MTEPMQVTPETILTAKEAAAYLRMGLKKFNRISLPCSYIGRRRLYIVRDLVQFIERQKVA